MASPAITMTTTAPQQRTLTFVDDATSTHDSHPPSSRHGEDAPPRTKSSRASQRLTSSFFARRTGRSSSSSRNGKKLLEVQSTHATLASFLEDPGKDPALQGSAVELIVSAGSSGHRTILWATPLLLLEWLFRLDNKWVYNKNSWEICVDAVFAVFRDVLNTTLQSVVDVFTKELMGEKKNDGEVQIRSFVAMIGGITGDHPVALAVMHMNTTVIGNISPAASSMLDSVMGCGTARLTTGEMRIRRALTVLHRWTSKNCGVLDMCIAKCNMTGLIHSLQELQKTTTMKDMVGRIHEILIRLQLLSQPQVTIDGIRFALGIDTQNIVDKCQGNDERIKRELLQSGERRIAATKCHSIPIPNWVLQNRRKIVVFDIITASELAQTITLLVYDTLYRHVMMDNNNTFIAHLIANAENFSDWTTTQLFACEQELDESIIIARLQYLINLGMELRELGNFHSTFALVGGLMQMSCKWVFDLVDRHKRTHRGMLGKFDRLKRLVTSSTVYQAELSHRGMNKSIIPFLGHTLTALQRVQSVRSAGLPGLLNVVNTMERQQIMYDYLRGQQIPYVGQGCVSYVLYPSPGISSYLLPSNGGGEWVGPLTTCIFAISSRFAVGSVVLGTNEDLQLYVAWSLGTQFVGDKNGELTVLSERARIRVNSVMAEVLVNGGFL